MTGFDGRAGPAGGAVAALVLLAAMLAAGRAAALGVAAAPAPLPFAQEPAPGGGAGAEALAAGVLPETPPRAGDGEEEEVLVTTLEPGLILQGLLLKEEVAAAPRRLGGDALAATAWLAAFLALLVGAAARLELRERRRRALWRARLAQMREP